MLNKYLFVDLLCPKDAFIIMPYLYKHDNYNTAYDSIVNSVD